MQRRRTCIRDQRDNDIEQDNGPVRGRTHVADLPTFGSNPASTSASAICTKPLARQGMLLWHLDRVLDTQGGVHDSSTPAHAGRSPAA